VCGHIVPQITATLRLPDYAAQKQTTETRGLNTLFGATPVTIRTY